MIQADTHSTTVVLDGNPNTIITHRGTPVVDDDGTRAATVVFPGDVKAYRVEANGTETELTSFEFRVTEFSTPKTMPAELPPGADFTWCADFAVDGAENVRFDKPVVGWLDNFLGFEVGTLVPVGYYDRDEGVWKPMDDGLVVELLDTDGDGVVDALDGDGDGEADDLDGDGNFADEVEGLDDPETYAPSATYWRYFTEHFTVIDLNWCTVKFLLSLDWFPDFLSLFECDDCEYSVGSTVSARGQALTEEIPIAGTGLSLNYSSKRSKGYEVTIPVKATGVEVPDAILKVHVKLEVAGRVLKQEFEPEENIVAEFDWDGLDYLGRPAKDTECVVSVGYELPVTYITQLASGGGGGGDNGGTNRSFGMPGDNITMAPGRMAYILWKRSQTQLPLIKSELFNIEGWELSNVHTTNEQGSTLFRGDGSIKSGGGLHKKKMFLSEEIEINWLDALATDKEGNIYIGGHGYSIKSALWKIDINGNVERIGGRGVEEVDGVDARDSFLDIDSIAVSNNGDIYIGGNNKIRKIDAKTNIATTIAGTGDDNYTGDGGLAIDATFSGSSVFDLGVAFDTAGNIYVCDSSNYCIRKITPDGYINTIAGTGKMRSFLSEFPADGSIATDTDLKPTTVAINPITNEPYFIMRKAIFKIKSDGTLEHVAGIEDYRGGYMGDGKPAKEAQFNFTAETQLVFDEIGNLYVGDTVNYRIRMIDHQGIVTTVAGNGIRGRYEEGPAFSTPLFAPALIAITADGTLICPDQESLIRNIYEFTNGSATALNLSPTEVAFNESGVSHIFDAYSGLHLRTVDQDTGQTLYAMTYDAGGNLTAITDRFGDATTLDYDALGHPSAIVSPDGHRTGLIVDSEGNLIRITNPDGGFYQFTYDDGGLLTSKIDPEGHAYFRVYDEHGRVTQSSDQEGGLWLFNRRVCEGNATDYPVGSEIHTVQTGGGQTTTYVDLGNSTGYYSEITDPAGGVTTFHRSKDERHVEKSLPCGTDLSVDYANDPSYMYDYPASITRSIPSGKSSTTLQSIGYLDDDEDGAPETKTHTVSVDGRNATVTTDLLDGVVTATSPEGRTSTEEYDTETLLTSRTAVPGLYETAYQYDDRGRVTHVTAGNRTASYTYDGQGNVATITDAQNRTTSYTYDVMDRVTSVTRPDETTVRFDWSKNGNLEVLTVPSDVDHGFEYDNTDRNTAYDPPISPSYQYIYDNDHRLVRTVFPSGQTIENVYENGQLRRVRLPEGDVVMDYLCSSKVGTITMGTEFLNFEYDGPLVTSLEQGGELNALLTFGYDNTMRLESFGYAGETTALDYDLDGLLTTLGDFTIERDAGNGLPLAVDDETARLEREFNGYGEVESWGLTVAQNDVASFDLTRNDLGQIVARNETIAGVSHQYEYTYDALGRLLTVSRDGSVVEQYAYDNANGARSSETNALRNIVGREYAYDDEDHLLTAGNATFSYNADGFLTTKVVGSQETRYTYSSRGELKRVELPDGRVVEYEHDPLGRRITKKVDGLVVEKYLWQGRTQLLAVYDVSDELLMRFEYAGDRMPVRMVKDNQAYYLAYDQVGTLRAVFDEAGTVIKTVEYDSFGNVIADNDPGFMVPFGFAGGLHDRDTGLVRFGYRDYDPDAGRWTAKDPIGFWGGDLNIYGYVQNDPVNWGDPFGLYTEIIVWQPVTWTTSSFGHVSSNINGKNYSWAPGGWDTNKSASKYAERQKDFRSGVGTILNLTPEQEKKLVECYEKRNKEYDKFTNNCGDPHKDCLEQVTGIPFSDSFFPVNIGNDLLDSPYYGGSKFYEGPKRGFWDDAPWARQRRVNRCLRSLRQPYCFSCYF
eukprot:TRINITY_DN1620_c0_g2_i1.p1 TRINITY_DN1620_c0_g2~~TRINITY_DN1620_c0_g2_i1.p1  ORF type:complete len:1817 (+),score=315.73 TRINITY_DN1620_c0_g2_i1:8817-14267(+)